ncbi:hypothetical protein ACFQX6_24425 [Streptosporangium lutulentum]
MIVLPSGYARLSEVGRDVVITHELTHVATGATRGGRVPMWLSEGFADYVGYRDAGIAVRTVAAELAGRCARASCPPGSPGPPTSLPATRGWRRPTRRRGSPAASSPSASARSHW